MGPSRPWHPSFSSEHCGSCSPSTFPSFPGERCSCGRCPNKETLLASAAYELASLDPRAVCQRQLCPFAGEGQLAACRTRGGLTFHQLCFSLEWPGAFSLPRSSSSSGFGQMKQVSTPHPLHPEMFLQSPPVREHLEFSKRSVLPGPGLEGHSRKCTQVPSRMCRGGKGSLMCSDGRCARAAGREWDLPWGSLWGATQMGFSTSGHLGGAF